MAHHPWYRFPLLWSVSTKVGIGYVVPVICCHGSVSLYLPGTRTSELISYSVCFQWMFWGYSLAYSRTASPFIGNMDNFGLKNVMSAPSPGSALLPEIVFCLYQMLFCACTVQLVIGGSFERGRIMPSMIFAFCWATIVYCPIACWTWNVSRDGFIYTGL
jgi:ammonia channel protein AmtB